MQNAAGRRRFEFFRSDVDWKTSYVAAPKTIGRRKTFSAPFGWYLGSTWLWNSCFAMQAILFTTLMTHYLQVPANELGNAQAVILIPQIVFMLMGGASGDKQDARAMLIRVHALAVIPPLVLAVVFMTGALNQWTLIAYALSLGILVSYAWPVRDAILNEIAPGDIQRAVTIVMGLWGAGNIVGNFLGGQHEELGVVPLLLIQSALFIVGVAAISRLSPLRPESAQIFRKLNLNFKAIAASTRDNIREIRFGIRQVWNLTDIRSVISLNVLSGFFNTGAWIVGFPIIVRDFYHYGPESYAVVMIGFSVGQIITNFLLYFVLPVKHPGRFLIVTLVIRASVLVLIYLGLPFFWFVFVVGIWGVNAGIAMTMARSIVQEAAPAESRARVMSIFSLGFMGVAPFGALAMGYLIEQFGVLNAILAGPISAGLVFIWVLTKTRLWSYEHVEGLDEEDLA